MALSDGNLEVVRVVALSPGDVAEERDTVALVVEELNRGQNRGPPGGSGRRTTARADRPSAASG